MAVIVIAEDEVHIARVVGLWLKKSNHVVHESTNGRAALELVRQHRPELLIADVNMPVMDGIELVRTCAAENLPTVGTIVLTSRCDQAEIGDQLQGLDVLLHAKPFSPSKLTMEVQQLLSRANGQAAPADNAAGNG
jgi:DNA-binding response OmpR family regulator